MLKIFEQLPFTQTELKIHTDALSKMSKDKDHKSLFSHLYECLSIIDGKSASLLSFNSIIIAVFAIFMAGVPSTIESAVLGSGILLVIVSSILLLFVVWIHWSTTNELCDLDEHAITLLKVRRARTIRYRIAWYFSIGSISLLTLFVIIRLIVS
jgi:type IV secretory pathway VirB3-like protein